MLRGQALLLHLIELLLALGKSTSRQHLALLVANARGLLSLAALLLLLAGAGLVVVRLHPPVQLGLDLVRALARPDRHPQLLLDLLALRLDEPDAPPRVPVQPLRRLRVAPVFLFFLLVSVYVHLVGGFFGERIRVDGRRVSVDCEERCAVVVVVFVILGYFVLGGGGLLGLLLLLFRLLDFLV
ncbi:hypothetical protein K445DRAFT_227497 [Daldinia sp. EC12]|nr:hypothetical protein K445DRAFT_227497 [Daldinia sp. EC12]